MKLGLCSVRTKNIYHESREMLFKNNLRSISNLLYTIDLYLGKFFKISFFPFEIGNFRLFQQARCEEIVKYTNCNLLEDELIKNKKE